MDDLALCSLYHKGLIPGPGETEKAFVERVALFLTTRPSSSSSISFEQMNKAFFLTKALFDVIPDWIDVESSSKGLRFWEAGAAWEEEDGHWKIRLNPKQRLAEQTEVLAHEAIHAVRAAFQERRFEEIMAFRTSEKPWRRFLGPLFQRQSEVWLLLLASLLDGVFAFFGYMLSATLLILLFYFGRLLWNQWIFSRCIAALISPNCILCLTDREIVAVAKGTSFSSLDDGSLRWRMVKQAASSVDEPSARIVHSDT
jgi:hypothetical protein